MTAVEELQRALQEDTETVPEGWLTVSGWAKSTERSESYTFKLLARLVKDGKWETKKFRIATATKNYPVPFYRPKTSR